MGLLTEKCLGPKDPRTQVSIKLPYRPNLTAWPPGPDVGLGYTPTGRLQGSAHDPAPLLLVPHLVEAGVGLPMLTTKASTPA